VAAAGKQFDDTGSLTNDLYGKVVETRMEALRAAVT